MKMSTDMTCTSQDANDAEDTVGTGGDQSYSGKLAILKRGKALQTISVSIIHVLFLCVLFQWFSLRSIAISMTLNDLLRELNLIQTAHYLLNAVPSGYNNNKYRNELFKYGFIKLTHTFGHISF